MMKTKLKFFLVLLAVLVGGVNGAWANWVYEEYLFDYSDIPEGTTLTTEIPHGGGKNITYIGSHSYISQNYNCARFYFENSAWESNDNQPIIRTYNGTKGLFAYYGTNHHIMAVLGLHNGDQLYVEYVAGNNNEWSTVGNIHAKATYEDPNDGNKIKEINSGEYLVSQRWYTIKEDGNFDINLVKYSVIKKIVILTETSPSFQWSDAELNPKFDTSNGGKLLRYKITDMNFTEPTAMKQPTSAAHTVRSLNQNVAIMDEHNFGDVLFVNTGTVNIQGTIGNNYIDTYIVDVWADVAEFTDVNNRYEVTGIGKLQEKEVTAVRGLKMNFGSDEDATLVLYDETYNVYVAYTINKLNGWRHRDAGAQSTIPTHGSFYKFEALTNGKLKFSGVKNGDDNTVVLMDASEMSGSALFTIGSTEKGVKGTTDEGIQLTAGHTYYLFGNVPTDGNYYNSTWSAYMLTWFSFESEFKLVNTINNVETEVSYGAAPRIDNNNITSVNNFVTVKGDTNPTVSIVGSSGDIDCSSANISKTTSGSNCILGVSGLSGSGGAIRIRVVSSAGGTAYFTLTIPYATHSWDFRTGTRTGENAENGQTREALATEIKSHGINDDPENYPIGATLGLSGVTRVYRSSNKNDAGVWEHITDPLLVAKGNVEGDNGFYIDKTSGLIFVTGAQSFGALETKCVWQKPTYTEDPDTHEIITTYSPQEETSYDPNHVHGLTEVDDETEYYFGPKVTTEAEYVYMKTGSKIIFPGVRPGQYIKIYTRRLSSLGDHWRAENLIDLEDKPYTSSGEFQYLGINEDRSSTDGTPDAWAGNNLKGSAIFKVPVTNNTTGSTAYNVNNTDISQMPSLTVTNGWVRILKIELLDEYNTDLYLSETNSDGFFKVDYDSEYASAVVYKKNGVAIAPVSKFYEGTVGKIGATHAHTCDYEVVKIPTTLDVTVTSSTTGNGPVYNNITLTFNGGNGLVKVIQREYGDDTNENDRANQHIINKKETYIAVSEVNVQDYPYTWDFTTHNMYKGSSTTATDLASATGTDYGTWTNPEGNTFQVNANATVNTSMEQLNTSPSSYEQVTKPLFAQGGQLSIGSTAVAEVKGLGISRPNGALRNMYTWKTTAGNFGRAVYQYKTYDLTTPIMINGSALSGASTITIPQVNDGMYIFVKATNDPTVGAEWIVVTTDPDTGETTTSYYSQTLSKLTGNDDIFSVADGVRLYKNTTGHTADIYLNFSASTEVEIVAVTDIVKEIGPTGYATESRDCAIDHSYQSKLTTHPVHAYGIEEYDGTYNYKGFPQVKKSWFTLNTVPAKNGVLLFEDQNTHDANGFNSPLFVPAVNNTSLTQDQLNYFRNDNWLAPSVNWNGTNKLCSEGVHFYNLDTTIKKHIAKTGENVDNDVDCEKFILTNVYYTYYKDDSHVTGQHTANTVGFYRLKVTGSGATEDILGGNKAYLLVPKANLPLALWNGGNGEGVAGRAREGIIYIDLEDLEKNDATVIDNAIIESSKDDNVYYSISGARIYGKPTTKGFYIHSGKKVSVK